MLTAAERHRPQPAGGVRRGCHGTGHRLLPGVRRRRGRHSCGHDASSNGGGRTRTSENDGGPRGVRRGTRGRAVPTGTMCSVRQNPPRASRGGAGRSGDDQAGIRTKGLSDLPQTRTIRAERQGRDQACIPKQAEASFRKASEGLPRRGAPVADEAPPMPNPRHGAGSASPTLSEVARRAQVSIGTASKALNGRGQLRAETRQAGPGGGRRPRLRAEPLRPGARAGAARSPSG